MKFFFLKQVILGEKISTFADIKNVTILGDKTPTEKVKMKRKHVDRNKAKFLSSSRLF